MGYNLIVLVYDRVNDDVLKTTKLNFQQAIFIQENRTGDYQTTRGLREILGRSGNLDDVVAFLEERNLPLDEIGRITLAERTLHEPPEQGYLTISNALQWRLQYSRAIQVAVQGTTEGVENLLG